MPNSNPGLVKDQKPSAADWNSYFTAKVDAFEGIMTSGTIVGSTIDGSVIGGNTAAAAAFTAVTINATGSTLVPSPPADTMLHLVGTASKGRIVLDSFSQVNFGGVRANGVPGTPTALLSGQAILVVQAGGYGATGYSAADRADMTLRAAQDWTDAHQGTEIDFHVTPNGGTVSISPFGIDNSGVVLVGTAAVVSGSDALQVAGGASIDTLHVSNSGTVKVTPTSAALVVAAGGTAPASFPTATVFEFIGPDTGNARVLGDSFGGALYFGGRRADNNSGTLVALSSTEPITGFEARGWDGTIYSNTQAFLHLSSDGSWTGTSHPTRFDFSVTPAGSTTGTIAASILNSGIVTVGTIGAVGTQKLQVTGGISADTLQVSNSASIAVSLGTNPFVIDGSGGTIMPTYTALAEAIHIIGSAGASARITADTFGTSWVIAGRRADGTPSAPTHVLANETLLQINAYGYGATGYSATNRANITLRAAEDWSDTAQGAEIDFVVAANGGTTTAAAGRIQNSGIWTIGGTIVADANKLQVTGGLTSDLILVNASGTTAPSPPADTFLQMAGGTSKARLHLTAFSQVNISGSRANGTPASPSAVTSAQPLLVLAAGGYGATGFSAANRGNVTFRAAENWTDAHQGTEIDFTVTTNGGTVQILPMYIDNSGIVAIGTAVALAGTDALQIAGGVRADFLNLGTLSGAPLITSGTGVPTITAAAASMWIRTDGSAGARMYINQNGTSSWAAIAGV